MINETKAIDKIIELSQSFHISWREELDGRAYRAKYKGVELYIQEGWLALNDYHIKNEYVNKLFSILDDIIGKKERAIRESIKQARLNTINQAFGL